MLKVPKRLPRPDLRAVETASVNRRAEESKPALDDDELDAALSRFTDTFGGAGPLLAETRNFLARHGNEIRKQLQGQRIPSTMAVSASRDSPVPYRMSIDALVDAPNQRPTHLLALQESKPSAASAQAEPSGLLLPIHATPYELQCAAVQLDQHAESLAGTLPVVNLRVPRPHLFHCTHEFMYTRDADALHARLCPPELVPAAALPKTKAGAGADALAPPRVQPPLQVLLDQAWLVHAAWANGAAIRLRSDRYWATLEHAWSLLVAALEQHVVVQDSEERCAAQ